LPGTNIKLSRLGVILLAVAVPVFVASFIELWRLHTSPSMFLFVPLLMSSLAISLVMAIYWREWRALTFSLIFAMLSGYCWIQVLIHSNTYPHDGGMALLGDILLLASAPATFGALAGLWRIFENQSLFQQGQLKLVEYEARYRHLIETATDAFYAIDVNGHLTLVNAAAARLFGRRAADLEKTSFFTLVDEATSHTVRDALNSLRFKDIKSFYHEFQITRRDNTKRWVGQNLQLLWSNTEICGFQAVLRDITERHDAQDALKQSETRLRTLFDTLSEGVLQTASDGRIAFCNPAATRILDLTEDELKTRHYADTAWDFIRSDGSPMPVEEWVAFRAHRERHSVPRTVTGIRRKEGSLVWLSAAAEPILGKLGLLEGVVITFTDITKSKAAEENLKMIEFALDRTREHVYLVSRDGHLAYANKSAMETLGYSAEDIVTLTIFQIAPDITKEDWSETWHQACRGSWPTFEANFVAREGRTFPTSTSASHVEFNGREYLFAFSRDLSREAELATQLRHAQKMEAIGTLAGGIAHDFNNILSGVLGYSELALQDTPEGSPNRHFIQEIITGGARATNLVRQILTFSRQGEQKQQPLTLAPVIKEALKLLRGSLPATITIRESIASDCGPVMGDPGQIHQIIMNLCTNAYHAMREKGGTLTVSLREVKAGPEWTSAEFCLKHARYAELSITDTGCGMDAATRQRIFEPFFTTKKQGEGTGLGLSTVHGIVKSHKGGIRVQSEPGKGTQFEILLPLCERGTKPVAEDIPDTPLPRGTECLLFVDDEAAIRDSMSEGLRRLGYTVETAENGSLGLAKFETSPKRFALVITDQTMPQMTGFDMARRILQLRPGQRILLCTGFDDTLTRSTVKQGGVSDLLAKPYAISAVSRMIRQILASSGQSA
jgi:PAS domain S-box-containing protein